jgi:hypothetical protein
MSTLGSTRLWRKLTTSTPAQRKGKKKKNLNELSSGKTRIPSTLRGQASTELKARREKVYPGPAAVN